MRSIIRISPARTCGYSMLARSTPADRGEDDVVEVALAAAVSLHRVEAELERRDPLRAVRAADRAVHGALDRERRRLDQLRPVVDLVELVETLHAVRIGDGDERVELPEVLDGSAIPCSCAIHQRMSEATEPPRWVCSSASPSPSRIMRRVYGRGLRSVECVRIASRSAATNHCLTGCGIGEVLGMVLATWWGWGNAASIALAIVLAFFFGYSLTLIPLLRAGTALGAAIGIALVADTLSIATMELVDNAILLVWPGALDAGLGDRALLGLTRDRAGGRLGADVPRQPRADQARARASARTARTATAH